MRRRRARHIPTIGKGKRANSIAIGKTLEKRSHGRQIWRAMDTLWEWERDFTSYFKISHIRVCSDRTVSHIH
jgi:hypothetical protein